MSVTENTTKNSRKRKHHDDEGDELLFFTVSDDLTVTPSISKIMYKPEPKLRSGCGNDISSGTVTEVRTVQFFLRMFSESKTISMQASWDDTVETIHNRILGISRIPLNDQRLLFRGKQLRFEQTLAECGIERDSELQLIGRLRSTQYPGAWKEIDDMVSAVVELCKGEVVFWLSSRHEKSIKDHLTSYLSMIPAGPPQSTKVYLDIFMTALAPNVLVTLYMSPYEGNRKIAVDCLQHFLNTCVDIDVVPKNLHSFCAPMVFKFCKLLEAGNKDKGSVYKACRYTLGVLLEGSALWTGSKREDTGKEVIGMSSIFRFINELKNGLCKDLKSSMESITVSKPLAEDVRDFKAFLIPVKNAIKAQIGYRPLSFPLHEKNYVNPYLFLREIKDLYIIFTDMLGIMNDCLEKTDRILAARGNGVAHRVYSGWSQYLPIIKELHDISKLYFGAEESFWNIMRIRKNAVRALVLRYAKRTDDHFWLLGRNDVTDFESRRHLVMLMLPEIKDEYDGMHEMLIDRSKLLDESFAYIAQAEPESLHIGLFMEFKNEEATGPGVLREWFLMVCQALFNQPNALFVSCQGDPRRFYPNPASKVDPLHLEYFTFSGRVIALALMHRVQVGILFARCFFLQLAGKNVSLEDIQDADPFLFNSCKRILDMNADLVDSDALGLTFVDETEELGSRKDVELCMGGKSLVVNSNNREEYIGLLIQHRFVKSVTEQVTHFAKGFNDMLRDESYKGSFFQNLELEDVDRMLYGSEDTIHVEDWKAHTDYNGYEATDPQIVWFWKIVGEMSTEQKRVLLFFWTSVKYLPYSGFSGLASRLCIGKTGDSCIRLPSSHTCFYKLCFPPYPTMAVMQSCLNIITQEHVGSSFGTW